MDNSAHPPLENKKTLAPIDIRVDIPEDGSNWKSIGTLAWCSIPGFAVLTGPNGSGKTQLLELLAFKLSGSLPQQGGNLGHIKVTVEGDSFGPGDVVYLPSRWEMTGAYDIGLAQLQSAKQQLWNELQPQNIQHDIRRRNIKRRIERLLGIENVHSLGQQEFEKRLPNDFTFMLEESDVVIGLAHVFIAYRLRAAALREKDRNNKEVIDELGKAPWDVLNEVFLVADFPYSVVSPTESDMLSLYKFELRHRQTDQRIQPADLSSGEKMLMGLVF